MTPQQHNLDTTSKPFPHFIVKGMKQNNKNNRSLPTT